MSQHNDGEACRHTRPIARHTSTLPRDRIWFMQMYACVNCDLDRQSSLRSDGPDVIYSQLGSSVELGQSSERCDGLRWRNCLLQCEIGELMFIKICDTVGWTVGLFRLSFLRICILMVLIFIYRRLLTIGANFWKLLCACSSPFHPVSLFVLPSRPSCSSLFRSIFITTLPSLPISPAGPGSARKQTDIRCILGFWCVQVHIHEIIIIRWPVIQH